MKNSFSVIVVVLVVLILVGIVAVARNTEPEPDSPEAIALKEFDQCLADEGAEFYGAIWCPACASQKAMFGLKRAESTATYIECSLVQGTPLNQVCQDAGIEVFPTWDFADGSRLTGVQTLEALAEKTSCELPDIENIEE